jgi:hypothetical protein
MRLWHHSSDVIWADGSLPTSALQLAAATMNCKCFLFSDGTTAAADSRSDGEDKTMTASHN